MSNLYFSTSSGLSRGKVWSRSCAFAKPSRGTPNANNERLVQRRAVSKTGRNNAMQCQWFWHCLSKLKMSSRAPGNHR
eukprot:5859756-Alexandrium_andersonii.AAC.1